MKPFFRVVVVVALLGIASLIGLAIWRVATRPKAIGWSLDVIQSRLTRGMSHSAVIELLGPPHSGSESDGYMYVNSYLSNKARHHSQTPSAFFIYFKDGKVDLYLTAHDY
jgi:hypothetical protein